VTDHFAVLGIPRSPWVDADELKERFLRLGARHHPDAPTGSGPAFTELNAALQALRDPAKCLRHYLELEHPGLLAESGQTPHELADLFMDIAAFRQDAQRFTVRLSAAGALARALLEPERIALRTRLEDLASNVAARTEQIVTALRSGQTDPGGLATLLASLVFLGKWSAHLAEARLAL
jgi:curved DNA-binding protein CbpA